MKKNQWTRWAVIAAVLAVMAWLFHKYVTFDWVVFWQQLRHADPKRILLGVACIYVTYLVRSVRWALFVRPTKKVGQTATLGAHFIGFTSVALFGRLADLARPYLIARRLQLPVSSQIAVYTIERMFDLGAAAILFSAALLFSPQIQAMPHHEAFQHVGIFSLAVTLGIAAFAVVIRMYGVAMAALVEKIFSRISPALGSSLAEKLREFRDGLNVLRSIGEFLIAMALSLGMWALVAIAYVQSAHAFVSTPALAQLQYGSAMLLMATSIGGSLVQMPVAGWFTQIALTAAAMEAFYGVPIEAATACGAVLLFVTSISIIPMGLIYAQAGHISLQKTVEASESAE
jgi:glycosyltransferase 2 family protein